MPARCANSCISIWSQGIVDGVSAIRPYGPAGSVTRGQLSQVPGPGLRSRARLRRPGLPRRLAQRRSGDSSPSAGAGASACGVHAVPHFSSKGRRLRSKRALYSASGIFAKLAFIQWWTTASRARRRSRGRRCATRCVVVVLEHSDSASSVARGRPTLLVPATSRRKATTEHREHGEWGKRRRRACGSQAAAQCFGIRADRPVNRTSNSLWLPDGRSCSADHGRRRERSCREPA